LYAKASLDRRHLLQPRLDGGKRSTKCQTAGGSSQGIGHVVATWNGQSQAQFPVRRHHHEFGAALPVERYATGMERLILILDGEGTVDPGCLPLGPEGAIGVDDGGSLLAQTFKNLALGVKDTLKGAEALQMGRRHVIDEGGIGSGQR